MDWLRKHSDFLFNATAIVYIIIILMVVWGIYEITGLPNNSINQWNVTQWSLIKFVWIPSIFSIIFYLIFATFCFRKRFFVFPIMLIYTLQFVNNTIGNLKQIVIHGFIYPIMNIGGIISLIGYMLVMLGTLLWINNIREYGKKGLFM